MPVGPDDAQQRLLRLLDEFGARLHAAVEARCGRNSGLDPADIEQEVRIRLWQALERDRNAPFGASYIQKVVLSVVIDGYRRVNVRAAEPLQDANIALVEALIERQGPDRSAVDAERMRAVVDAVAALPGRRRVAMQLHLQGFSLVEIARLTGSTDEAVRKLVTRGLEELRTRLRESGMDEFDD